MPDIRNITFLLALVLLNPNLGLGADETISNASPLQIAIGQPIQAEDKNRIAEAEGNVTFVGQQGYSTYLELSSEYGYMPVSVKRGAGYLTDLLLMSRVRVRGICSEVYSSVDGNMVGSLSASGLNDITILQLPEATWLQYPIKRINALTVADWPTKVIHLRGKVERAKSQSSFLLFDETGQITVNSKQTQRLKPGTEVEVLGVWEAQGSNKIFQSISFRSVAGTTNEETLPLLTTTEQIRWLKPDEASRQFPVKIRGVITFLRSGGGNIEDGTGGIFMWALWEAGTNSELRTGDYCELEGVTSEGDFSPIIYCRKITVLGTGTYPKPIQPSWSELIGGGLDAQWVEIEGVVLSVTNHDMYIGMKGGDILSHVNVPKGENLEHFLNSVVRVRGVVLAFNDKQRHINGVRINVPAFKFISLEIPAPDDPFSAPVEHAKDLFTYSPDASVFREIKMTGQIVLVRDDVFYMMDGTNGVRLIPKNNQSASVGDIVEAVGFPDVDSPFDKPSLTLRDAIVRKTSHEPLPNAIKITADDMLNREHDATLVQINSRLLGMDRYRMEQVLELQTGAIVYRARLGVASGELSQLRPGSLLEVTGVYSNSRDKSVPFELLLNSPANIRVLELPSWWTAQHALALVTGMAMLIILFLIWNGVLRQQVGRRTMELSTANQSLKNEITERKRAENELVQTRLQHLVEQERTRIARDLHDDLGSRVTRIVLLNELALQNRVPPENAGEHALEISSAARQVIQSLDETVWAVNPRNDTLPQLLNYLSQFAIEFLKTGDIRCRLDFPDYPSSRPISAEARHNLFLAVKEALNNIARHAHAPEVWLRAVVNEDSLVLEIEDNGCGFEGAPDHPSADGLRNMQQRMQEIGGVFQIESAPKTGTKVRLTFFWSSGH